jgi:hypothetical protein
MTALILFKTTKTSNILLHKIIIIQNVSADSANIIKKMINSHEYFLLGLTVK